MRRLPETFSLSPDGWAFLGRMVLVSDWHMDTVRPGDVFRSRRATRITSGDARLDSDQDCCFEILCDAFDFFDAASLFVTGFEFQADDQEHPTWFPQGLSGSADADESGKVDGETFLLVAWYLDQKKFLKSRPASRVSLINIDDMDEVTYRHILLVNPVQSDDGIASFESVNSHCGGIVWFGRWLYVATSNKLLVFDMDRLTDIKGQNTEYLLSEKVGYYQGKYHAGGYRYILPLIAVYAIDDNGRGDYFDTLGLDRTTDPPRIVAAGYVNRSSEDYDKDIDHAVVVFFDLDPSTGLLATTGGHIHASEAAWTGEQFVQGVNASGNTIWLCQSSEVNKLLVRTIGGSGGSEYDWAAGGEGLTYFEKSDLLWNVTELEKRRICFAVKRDSVS